MVEKVHFSLEDHFLYIFSFYLLLFRLIIT